MAKLLNIEHVKVEKKLSQLVHVIFLKPGILRSSATKTLNSAEKGPWHYDLVHYALL